MNFADPPPANPPPVPDVVFGPAQQGLDYRNYRPDRPGITTTKAKRELARKKAAARASAAARRADAGIQGLISRRRRGLRATPFRSASDAAGGNATVAGGGGRTDASGGHGGGYGFGGIGLARKITGRNIGFDGIGVPETRLIPEDLSLAVGNTAAIHTANSMIRFYRVDITGKKGKHGFINNPKDTSSYLKQVWTADFFYPVRLGSAASTAVRGLIAWHS
jgi:hypothetical protein